MIQLLVLLLTLFHLRTAADIVMLFFNAGGAAGSVAVLSGSIGSAFAALSFDEDYQKVCRLGIVLHLMHSR